MSTRTRRPSRSRAQTPSPEGSSPAPSGALATEFGQFEVQHEALSATGSGTFSGSEILIAFAASHPVTGEFAMVQAVQSERGTGDSQHPNPGRDGTNDAAITTDEGWRIDNPYGNHPVYGSDQEHAQQRLADPHNHPVEGTIEDLPEAVWMMEDAERDQWLRDHPLRGVDDLQLGTPDLDANQAAGDSQVGHRVASGTDVDAAPAVLHDAPGFTPWTTGTEPMTQTFETAVLSTAGPMAGSYLGTLSWGHTIDAEGQVALQPAQVASRGTPTGTFDEAAERWNQAVTVDGPSVDLPE